MKDQIRKEFELRFGGHGECYSSAGRINLIGEHTDYNDGFVFPGAIDKCIVAEIRPNGTAIVNIHSIDMDEQISFGLDEDDAPVKQWAKYIFGVCRETIKRGGCVEGFDAVFAGDIPLGAGLSSSAALESVFAYAINDLFNDNSIDKFELAKIGQATEHNYCGVKCGIMDQFASIFGKKGHLMRLDCRSLEYEYFPFNPTGYRLVLVDSAVKHELVGSPYNRRRESCERIAKRLGLKSLREATMDDLESIKDDISEEDYKRARFVIGEKKRVLNVCDALVAGDYATVGKLMYETHEGLSKDYEVSCEELDFLNEIARKTGVCGSRIMGGGFGGCTINLVNDEVYDTFIETARKEFAARYGHEPIIHDVVISDGAHKCTEAGVKRLETRYVASPKGDVELFTLTNADGASVTLTNIGAGITSIIVPDRHGHMADVLLGYDNPLDHIGDGACAGSIPGRYANRIAHGRFSINGKEYSLSINNGPNSLHGGPKGFHNCLWDSEIIGDDCIRFSRTSPDGEEGYPGTLKVSATYRWRDDNRLELTIEAETDAPTVVNLTSHPYFNLGGHDSGSVLDHELWLGCSRYLPTDDTLIPTGEKASVEGTPMDFTSPHALGRDINEDFTALKYGKGYDNCWIVDGHVTGGTKTVAILADDKSGRTLEIESDQPGIQVYTGNWLSGSPKGKGGHDYKDYEGVAIECQDLPDAPNHPDFPQTRLNPVDKYRRVIIFKFKTR